VLKIQLNDPPYLQIALDIVDERELERILSQIPVSSKIIFEAGTPLIKKFGINIVEKISSFFPDNLVLADLKTLDVASVEIDIAYEGGAHLVAISGLASLETIESAIKEAEKKGLTIILDLMNVSKPIELLNSLSKIPKIILFHRGIDQEGSLEHPWRTISKIKKEFSDSLIAVAGGLNLKLSKTALRNGADIIVIGREITTATDIKLVVSNFLSLLD